MTLLPQITNAAWSIIDALGDVMVHIFIADLLLSIILYHYPIVLDLIKPKPARGHETVIFTSCHVLMCHFMRYSLQLHLENHLMQGT